MLPFRRLAIFLFVFSLASFSQQSLTGASVSGILLDPSGAAIRGAKVEVIQETTTQARTFESGHDGRFRFPSLPPGLYHLTVAASGFKPFQQEIRLLLGQSYDLPVALSLAGADETIFVNSQAPLVDTLRTQISASVTPPEIRSLPLNGRNYLDLALLVPNVSRTNTGTTQRVAETSAVPGTGISVAGQRNLNNSFIVDGLSANDDAAELAGTFYSQEVIQEFQVVTSGIAEFGRSSAGAINIITRSGGSRLHGDLYGFLRNQRLDASNPLSRSRLPLTQSQYGGTLGGPILKGRTFYFANFEQTRQNASGIITIAPADIASINTRLGTVGYKGPRIATGIFPATFHTTNLFGRIDHRWKESLQSILRYSFYDVNSINARTVGGLNTLSRGSGLADRDQTIALNTIWAPSPRTLYESRFQFTRSRLAAPVNDTAAPAVNISGVASFGAATFSPTGRDIDLFEIVGNISHQRGSHSIKGGIDYLHNRVGIEFPGALPGVYSFSSLANFLSGNYLNFQQAFGVASTFQNNPNLGLFLEDEWKLRPGLTLNAGLRYDLQFLPDPVRTDANNFAPRVGLAWDPWRDGKTVIRASYGLFNDRIPLRAVSNALQRDGIQYKVALVTPNTAGAPVFPNVLPAFPAGLLTNITTIDPNIRNSYSHQGNLQISRELPGALTLDAGYMSLRAHGLIISRNLNVPATSNPAIFNLGRPIASYANNSQFQSLGNSWYDGMTVALQKRAGSWAAVRLSYTLSKTLDTSGNFFFSTPQDNFNIAAEKGRSDNDQRHRLAISGNIASPVRSHRSPWQSLIGGWQLGWIYACASPLPFNILTGNDRNGDSNANDRPAGVDRNSGVGFGSQTLDLRVSRPVTLHESFSAEFMADVFNVFNQRNNMIPNNVFGTGTIARASFGQPTAVGDPRQIQLGLRLRF